jgi:hypothetical protein
MGSSPSSSHSQSIYSNGLRVGVQGAERPKRVVCHCFSVVTVPLDARDPGTETSGWRRIADTVGQLADEAPLGPLGCGPAAPMVAVGRNAWFGCRHTNDRNRRRAAGARD